MNPAKFLATLVCNRRHRPCDPRLLTYLVTYACNARCAMCDSWRQPTKNELDAAAIERLFSGLPNLDAIRLTGGEPFLRQDLPEIAQLAISLLRPRMLHVTTNGLLSDRIVRFCERRPRGPALHLLVSLDAVAGAHDTIRGVPGAFERAMATLETLARHRRRLDIRLAVNQTVVDGEALQHYRGLKERLARIGLPPPQVVLAYAESATYTLPGPEEPADGSRDPSRLFHPPSRSALCSLLAALIQDLHLHPLTTRLAKGYYLSGVSARLLAGRASPSPPCAALKAHLRILPDGTVPTCQFNSTPVGSLSDRSFPELWYGPKAARQRSWVAACPGCWAECEILPSAIYSGDFMLRLVGSYRPTVPEFPEQFTRSPAKDSSNLPMLSSGSPGGE